MSNSNALHRIGSYDAKQGPETFLGDCEDLCAHGVAHMKVVVIAAFEDRLQMEQEKLTMERGGTRLNRVKGQLRAANFDVRPLDDARVAELKQQYADAFRKVTAAIAKPYAQESVTLSKELAILLRDAHVLAERLLEPLTKAVNN